MSFQKRVKAEAKRYRSTVHFRSVRVRAMYLPRWLAALSAASAREVLGSEALVEEGVVLCWSLWARGVDLEAMMARITMSAGRSSGKQ